MNTSFELFFKQGDLSMYTSKRVMAIVCAIATVFLSMSTMADSKSSISRKADRNGTWDFYLPLTYATEAKIDGQGGSTMDINDDIGYGFGFGYNINNKFQVNGLVGWNSRTYNVTAVADDNSIHQYNNFLETHNISLNGIYYFLETNLTPFISGTVGYTWLDTNIQDAPATGDCWYDPIYGYVCAEYVPTKVQSEIHYGGGLGVRYDINDAFSLQGDWNRVWIDMRNSSGTPEFDTWRLDFIFRIQ